VRSISEADINLPFSRRVGLGFDSLILPSNDTWPTGLKQPENMLGNRKEQKQQRMAHATLRK